MFAAYTIAQLKEQLTKGQDRNLLSVISRFHQDIKPKPIPEKQERNFLIELCKELNSNITPKATQTQNEKAIIEITNNTFKNYDLELKYCGFYEPDKKNPERTNPRPYNIGIGCSGIPIYEGVIGTTVRLYGKSVYIIDVAALEKEDPKAHFSCDSSMQGAEIVIALRAEYKTGPQKGKSATRMTLDLDISRKNALSIPGATLLEEIILPFMRITFPEPPVYEPLEGIHTPKNLNVLANH